MVFSRTNFKKKQFLHIVDEKTDFLICSSISRVFFQPADQSDASNTVVKSEAESVGAGVEDDCDS